MIRQIVTACTVKATQGRVSVKIKVQQLYGVKHLAKVVVLNLYKLGSLWKFASASLYEVKRLWNLNIKSYEK